MYRSLAEAAANCTRNIATGYGPIFSDRKELGGAAILTREEPLSGVLHDDLEKANPTERVPELINALKNADCGMRVSAVCALARLGPASEGAVPALTEALTDRDWVVRVAAITALGEIGKGAGEAVPALIEALEKEDVCASATIALGRIGPAAKSALPALGGLQKSKSGFVRWCAEEAVRSIGR
jgi:HEAT repeat protein